MELELKHIKGYLDTRLKVINIQNNKEFELELDFLDYVMKNKEIYKLLLRSPSQLTKEIEHNGEKFVPMGRLSCLYKFEKRGNFYLSMYIDDSWIYSCNELPYDVIEKLLEWHFDIFGLIENNLAIEIK